MIVPSIRALAKVIGISYTALERHLKNGKFEAEPDGGFDPGKVKAALDRNRDVGHKPRRTGPTDTRPRPSVHDDYNQSRALREHFRAKREEMDFEERAGKLISADDARKTWHAIGRMYGQARENVPMQLAPRLVGKTNLSEIEGLIRDAYREADTRIADEIQSRFGAVVGAVGG